jgi:hypothetical protein
MMAVVLRRAWLGAGFCILGSLGVTLTRAQDIAIDENALFADTSSITDSAATAQIASGNSSTVEAKTVGFSGHVLWVGQGLLSRDYFESPDIERTSMGNQAVGDLALDVRLLRGYKAFADLEWIYSPEESGAGADSNAAWRIPEMFVDANIQHRLYFRVGKQILQWGRCYFFNPTDLVNIERKSFLRRIGNREGVYGAKVHVPFGTVWNLYGFLDLQGVNRVDSVAGAFRVERLWGATEMSIMVWDKGYRYPVYGADLSTRLWKLDVNAEAALHPVYRSQVLSFENGLPELKRSTKDWQPKASVSVGRGFRVSGIQDRLNTVAEYFYNGPGNSDRRLGLASFLNLLTASGLSASAAQSALATSGVYEANAYSQHYAALFATFSRFLRNDLTLSANAISNLNQNSAILSAGLAYQDLNDFGLSLNVNGFVGPKDSEYAISGQALQVQLLAEVAF